MKRKDYEYGAEGHNINPETLECPVCGERLISDEYIYSFDDGTELWSFICPDCEKLYVVNCNPDNVIDNLKKDIIEELTGRIERLENIISRHKEITPIQSITPSKYKFLID